MATKKNNNNESSNKSNLENLKDIRHRITESDPLSDLNQLISHKRERGRKVHLFLNPMP